MRQEEQEDTSYWAKPDLKFNVRHIRKRLEQIFKAPAISPVGEFDKHRYLLDPRTKVHRRHNARKLDHLFTQVCGQYLDFNQGKPRWFPERHRNIDDFNFWHNFKQWQDSCKAREAATKLLEEFTQEQEVYEALEGSECEYEDYHPHPDETGYCGDDLPTDDNRPLAKVFCDIIFGLTF